MKSYGLSVTDKQYRRFLFSTGECKKCGSTHRLIRHAINGVYILCSDCGNRTNTYKSLDMAIDEWNGCKDPLFSEN